MRARPILFTLLVLSAALLAASAKAEDPGLAERAADALTRLVCKDKVATAKFIAEVKEQQSEGKIAADIWDFNATCATIDLPRVPVHDTADPSTDATHTNWIFDAQYSPDGKSIVSTGFDGTLRVWDAETGKPKIKAAASGAAGSSGTIAPARIRSVTFIGTGALVAAAGDSSLARVFDAVSGKMTAELPFKPANMTEFSFGASLAGTSDGLVFVGGAHDEVLAIEAASNTVRYRLPGHGENASSIAVSETARLVATAAKRPDNMSLLQFWKLDTGEKTGEIAAIKQDSLKLNFSRDGKLLAVVAGGDALIYSVTEKKLIQTIKVHPYYSAFDAAFTADGKGLVTCQAQPALWDIASGKLVRYFGPFRDLCHTVDVSPDGKFAVTGSMGSDVRVWEIATGVFHRRLGRDVHPPR